MRYTVAYFDNMSRKPEFDYISNYAWSLDGEKLKNPATRNVMKVLFKSSSGLLMAWGAIAIPETHHFFNVKLPYIEVYSLYKNGADRTIQFIEDELLDLCYEVLFEKKNSKAK